MPLSDREQRLLEQIEQSLYADDPKFASSVSARRLRPHGRSRLVLSGVGAVLGLFVVVGGLVFKQTFIGVVGFVMIVGSLTMLVVLLRRPAMPDLRIVGGSGPANGSRSEAKFRQRMEQRFRRRFDV
jgi:hypothetical protein